MKNSGIKLTWLGTAGFEFDIAGSSSPFLIDPFLTRGPEAVPSINLTTRDYSSTGQIYVSHGHFDHTFDIPEIVQTSGAEVFCSPPIRDELIKKNVPADRIRSVNGGETLEFEGYTAEPVKSRHIKFDGKLVITTLARGFTKIPGLWNLLSDYPVGDVLSWRFTTSGGTVLHHFGSAGSDAEEFESLSSRSTDILLIPLQGRTDICRVALNYVKEMKPRMVIPHHFDNFHPPISQTVDITPFIDGIESASPGTETLVPRISEPIEL